MEVHFPSRGPRWEGENETAQAVADRCRPLRLRGGECGAGVEEGRGRATDATSRPATAPPLRCSRAETPTTPAHSAVGRAPRRQRKTHPYFYPPLVLSVLWSPSFELITSYHIWFWLNQGLILAILALFRGWFRAPWWVLGGLLLTFTPITDNAKMGGRTSSCSRSLSPVCGGGMESSSARPPWRRCRPRSTWFHGRAARKVAGAGRHGHRSALVSRSAHLDRR